MLASTSFSWPAKTLRTRQSGPADDDGEEFFGFGPDGPVTSLAEWKALGMDGDGDTAPPDTAPVVLGPLSEFVPDDAGPPQFSPPPVIFPAPDDWAARQAPPATPGGYSPVITFGMPPPSTQPAVYGSPAAPAISYSPWEPMAVHGPPAPQFSPAEEEVSLPAASPAGAADDFDDPFAGPSDEFSDEILPPVDSTPAVAPAQPIPPVSYGSSSYSVAPSYPAAPPPVYPPATPPPVYRPVAPPAAPSHWPAPMPSYHHHPPP